jgi:uncharacterized protein YchJ
MLLEVGGNFRVELQTQMSALIYQNSPSILFATNTFTNVPIILQYDNTPLLQVVKEVQAGFTTKFSIYHSDGTYLAKAVGSRLFKTPDGEKVSIILRQEDKLTVCELDGRTLFEMRRTDAASLKTQAELYAPNGAFLKATDHALTGQITQQNANAAPLQIGGLTMEGCTINGSTIGIKVNSNGTVEVGVHLPHTKFEVENLDSPANLQAIKNVGQLTTKRPKVAKVGRNEKCPCGSGLKYKNCCGR